MKRPVGARRVGGGLLLALHRLDVPAEARARGLEGPIVFLHPGPHLLRIGLEGIGLNLQVGHPHLLQDLHRQVLGDVAPQDVLRGPRVREVVVPSHLLDEVLILEAADEPPRGIGRQEVAVSQKGPAVADVARERAADAQVLRVGERVRGRAGAAQRQRKGSSAPFRITSG